MRKTPVILLVLLIFTLVFQSCEGFSKNVKSEVFLQELISVLIDESPIGTSDNIRQDSIEVLVTKVIDGDTFWVKDGSASYKVRFIGMDTPDIRNSRYKKKGYYAEEAKSYVQGLTENKKVYLVFDVEKKDRYDRVLAYIYLKDGTFLNADLVKNGYAVVATFPPNVRYAEYFAKLQKQARQAQVGLWEKEVK